MRRCLAGLVVAGVLIAPSSAGPLTLRVRHDADDTRSVLDLERVMMGLSEKRALFGFATFGSFTIKDIEDGGRFQFNLDTKHLDHDDFHLYFIYWLATDELLCRLQTDHGLTIGERPVTFDNNRAPRSVVRPCPLPRSL